MTLELFSYWRSSASWRVRIALELKQLPYTIHSVHLTRDGGEQHRAAYRDISPEGLVPSLRDGDWSLSQSLAICEYLDAAYGGLALLPDDLRLAAEVRSFCALIACDTHPLNNLRILQYLENPLGLNESARTQWYRHWIAESFAALEARIAHRTAIYCFGDEPGLAECFLVPQMYNARRFDCPLEAYPRLLAIDALCHQHPAIIASHPDRQPDKPAEL